MKITKTRRPGFTLIELLVVVGIIAVLAVVVIVSLESSRSRSRDAKRSRDIESISTAVRQFNEFQNKYPECAAYDSLSDGCAIVSGVSSGTLNSTDYANLKSYIPVIPDDPKPFDTGTYSEGNNDTDYQKYRYVNQTVNRTDGKTGFGLLVLFENETRGCNDNWKTVYDTVTDRCACKIGDNIKDYWWGATGATDQFVPNCL